MAPSEPPPAARRGYPTLGFISALLIGLVALEYALWLPQYLTWPWWADHDVFATMAQGWDEGLSPYRDLIGNNFPGTIYLFWVAGKLWGWGNTAAYNGLDAALLGGFGLAVLAWSRRRFGIWLPGAVTLFALTHYYFELDFSLVAQRDWHAAMCAAAAMMAIEAMPGPSGRRLSALCSAVGFAIRPQVVVFVPALLWALNASGDRARGRGRSPIPGVDVRATVSWAVGFAMATALLFLPLILRGLLGDFVRGFATVLPGGGYGRDQGKSTQFAMIGVQTLAHGRVWGLPLAIALIWPRATPSARSSAIRWLLMLAGSVTYMAVTPVLRSYVYHPFWLVWAFLLGSLVAMLVEEAARPWRDRLMALLLLVMVMDVGSIPRACDPRDFLPAMRSMATGRPVENAPRGYVPNDGVDFVLFPWSDYQAILAYLRSELGPETRVANALKGIALTGPTARLPAFPAESATWLFVVRPRDEGKFVEALIATPDSVVVWVPELTGRASVSDRFPRLAQAIRRLYEPTARFGRIEVWRRRAAEREGTGRAGRGFDRIGLIRHPPVQPPEGM